MINDSILAEKLTTMLNAAATAVSAPFQFQIYSNIGDYDAAMEAQYKTMRPTPLINGTLIATSSQIVPLQSVKSYTMTSMLEFVAAVDDPQGTGIETIMSAIRYFVESNAGLAESIQDAEGNSYASVFAPQLPQVGQAQQNIGFWYIPVTLFLSWQFIEGGVISNEIGITVNGQNLVLLDGGVVRTRIVETYSPVGDEGLLNVVAQQGLILKITTPYLNIANAVSLALVQDLWGGSLAQSYSVEYNDGTVTQSVEMVATEIAENWSSGTVVSVTATLVPADTNVYTEEE